MKTAGKILISLIFVSLLLPNFTIKISAASASLYLSPSSGTKYVNDKFNVSIYVNSDSSTNTYNVNISVSNLVITGISTGGSICQLYPFQPNYNASSANFQCGITGGRGPGSGYIGAVIVQGKSPGTGKVSISGGSQVYPNDPSGISILTSTGSATFTILPPPTAAPTITSSTHPDQDKWYKVKDVSLSWSGGGSEFSYNFDQSADTAPDEVSEGSGTSKAYPNVTDGIWYFHVRVKGSGGWSGTTHFRVQIDTVPPLAFKPEADPSKDAEKRPVVAFTTTDATSGVDHYEIRIDNGLWVTATAPYKIPSITSGKHTIYVKAADKAGNEQIGSIDVTIKDIPAPKITYPKNGWYIPYSNSLTIRGSAPANHQVEIYLNDKKIATVKADNKGNFTYTYKQLLAAGKHTIYAVALNPDNISSPKSNIVNVTLDPHAVTIASFTLPGIVIYSALIGLIIILAVLIFFTIFRSRKFRKKLKELLRNLEQRVESDLTIEQVKETAKEKVGKDFQEAEEDIPKKVS